MKKFVWMAMVLLALGGLGCSNSSDSGGGGTQGSSWKGPISGGELRVTPNVPDMFGNGGKTIEGGSIVYDAAKAAAQIVKTGPLRIDLVKGTGELHDGDANIALSAWMADAESPLRLNIASTMLVRAFPDGPNNAAELVQLEEQISKVLSAAASVLGVKADVNIFEAEPAEAEAFLMMALGVIYQAATDAKFSPVATKAQLKTGEKNFDLSDTSGMSGIINDMLGYAQGGPDVMGPIFDEMRTNPAYAAQRAELGNTVLDILDDTWKAVGLPVYTAEQRAAFTDGFKEPNKAITVLGLAFFEGESPELEYVGGHHKVPAIEVIGDHTFNIYVFGYNGTFNGSKAIVDSGTINMSDLPAGLISPDGINVEEFLATVLPTGMRGAFKVDSLGDHGMKVQVNGSIFYRQHDNASVTIKGYFEKSEEVKDDVLIFYPNR